MGDFSPRGSSEHGLSNLHFELSRGLFFFLSFATSIEIVSGSISLMVDKCPPLTLKLAILLTSPKYRTAAAELEVVAF